MSRAIAKLLRAARKSTPYIAPLYSWEVGIVDQDGYANRPFKPGSITRSSELSIHWTDADLDASNAWDGARSPWVFALEQAHVGHLLDFYVYRASDHELVTNVAVKIISEVEAIVCDCGEPAQRISL